MNTGSSFYSSLILLLSFLILVPAASDVSAQGTIEPTPFIDLEYNYDAAGNVKSIINHIDPGMSATMSYDKLGRLTKTSGPWGNGRYTYDSIGNRTSKNINNEYASYGYTSSGNYLDDVVHDSSGNIVEDGDHRYVYDSEDRLIEVWSGDKRVAAYNYDVFGRRISKTDANGKTTYFAYGRGQKVLTEFNGNGSPRFDYIYAGSRKIARVDHSIEKYEGRVTFYHANHLGSNIALTDNYTSLVWDKEYLPFGGDYSNLNSDTTDNNHQYTSQELDKETGLYYFGARYYNPEIGRFMSVDPAGIEITNPQSWNRYSYVQNNPYKYVDPDGRQVVEFNSKRDAENFDPTSLVGPLSVIGPVKSLGSRIINSLTNYLKRNTIAVNSINNNLAKRVARVVDLKYKNAPTLGKPGSEDVFVTATDEIADINNSIELAKKLTLVDERGDYILGPYAILEFDTPNNIATPIFRNNPGFIGYGKTRGGAKEFVIPNLNRDQLINLEIRIIK